MISDSEQRFLGQQLFEPFTPAIVHRRDLISIAIRWSSDSEELVSLNPFVNTVELYLY